MVFGLQVSFARVGSTVNFAVMESIYNWVNKYYQGYMCTGMTLFIGNLKEIFLIFYKTHIKTTKKKIILTFYF